MALFLTVVLVLSIVGMSGLLALKHFEMQTGKVVLGAARPSVGAFFYRVLVWVEEGLPTELHRLSGQALVVGKKFLHEAIARGILLAEQWLERGLRFLRSTTAPTLRGQGQVSTFLREVAEHKKKLLTSARTTESLKVE